MVQTIKSVLLFEYDSVYRSLNAVAPGVGDMLGPRAGLWLEAIESGQIIQSANVGEDIRRRFQSKRCYASPEILGKNRGWLTANGMQVIDCTAPSGLVRGSGDIHLVLDALDAVDSEPDEIILVTAESDLTPLLFRLRAMNQRIVIYGTAQTAVSYQTFADAVVSQELLIEALSRPSEQAVVADKGAIPRPPRISMPEPPTRAQREPAPAPAPPPPARAGAGRPARQSIDRETLALLVRRIHQATNVPLFSPRAFADLFRLLAKEIAATGYKFQTNSENVAAEMNKLGRNVSKRQIGFVIKGLTLRGHIFSAEDTPESLAEDFYQQVLYLVTNAKLDLTEDEQGLIRAWIVGFRTDEEPARPMPRAETPASPVTSQIRPAGRRAPPPQAPRATEAARPRPAGSAATRPPVSRQDRPATERPPMKAAQRPVRVQPEPLAEPPGASFASRMARNGAAAAAPRMRPPPPAADREAELEDSILSAIADAVDVLADDTEMPPPRRAAAPEPVHVEPEPEDEPARYGDEFAEDEIGDEIQRILSSYSNRR